MDNTTLVTAVTLMSDQGDRAMTPLTVWDLATFVRAVVSYERIYHHAHPLVDDRAINRQLGRDVLHAIPLPPEAPAGSRLPDPWEGSHRFMCELWEAAHHRLRRLSASADRQTLDGQELRAVRDGWRRALKLDLSTEELTDWSDAGTRWTSPSDRLLREIVEGTSVEDTLADLGPDAPSIKLARKRTKLGLPYRGIGATLTDLNLRAYINQSLADFFELPYLCGAARVPFRKHLYDRAVAVQHRLTTLDVIDDRYGELAAGVQLRLPLFLATALPGAKRREDLWAAIARLRDDARPYRAARGDLDAALARRDVKEVARVSKALSTSVDSVLEVVGEASVRAAVAAVEQIAKGDVTGISAAVAGAEAAGRRLLDSSVSTRLMWRLRRPYLLWMSNVVDEAQRLTEALPDLQRLWRIPEMQLSTFAARFQDMAALQHL